MSAVLASPEVRRPSALRFGPPPPAAGDTFEQTTDHVRRACRSGRAADAVAAARAVQPGAAHTQAEVSMLREIAAFVPGALPPPREDQLWLLRRLDGSIVGLFRLRASGLIGLQPHENESRWAMRDGRLAIGTPSGRATTRFAFSGTSEGRHVHIGLFMDDTTVHVLAEVSCHYSELRMVDPELVGSSCGLIDPSQFRRAELPPVPAAIIAAQRTGSHLLLNLLNSSGRVFFDAEILNERHISVFGSDLKHEETGLLHYLRTHDPVNFAKVMMTRSYHEDGRRLDHIPVRGFKLFAKHSRPAWDWVMAEPGLRIVHLYRENLLAEYSSLLVAYAKGHWVGGPESLREMKIAFEPERFTRFVAMKRQYLAGVRAQLAARAGPSIEIEYSAFSHQNINRVLSFLLDEEQESRVEALGLKRQLAERVIDRFENPAAVMRALAAIGREDWAGVERPEVKEL